MRQKIDSRPFTFQTLLRARFTEADLQGMIHHSEFVKYLEIARIEYWRQLGIGYREFMEMGLQFVVSKVECSYLKSIYFDEMVAIKARVCRISRTSITFDYIILNESNEPAVTASTLLVCVRHGGAKPYPMPADYMEKLIAFEKPGTIELKTGKFLTD
jgi:acyl-CoA thioester hydrolase